MNIDDTSRARPFLVVEDIHAAYVKKEILRGVSFSVEQGEIVALLGGNGSGKSTLLKTIAGLLRPTRGRILLGGEDISQEAIQPRQQMGIGYLIQGGQVFSNLTVEENIMIALRHCRADACNKERPALGEFFPELRENRTIRAGLLSGGQRQMLAIEMVLAQDPMLALLDEPSSGLAPSLVAEVLSLIQRTATSKHMTVVLVEQNVEEARRIADRQLRLECGAVKQEQETQQRQGELS